MKLILCPTCRTIHESVSPAGLSRLSKQAIQKRLVCALCSTPSMSFRQTADAPDTPPGEIGYPAVVAPMFEHGFRRWWESSEDDVDAATQHGLPWRILNTIAEALQFNSDDIADLLGATPQRVLEGIRSGESMGAPEAGLVLTLARLIGQVEDMAERTGKPEGARPGPWVGQWLLTPNDDLQGRLPAEFLSTPTRRRVLCDLIGSLEEQEDREARIENQRELLAGVALEGLRDVAAGRILSEEELNHALAAAVPNEFPRAGEGSLAGAQPKLAARLIDGMFVVGETAKDRRGRYDACLALVEFLVPYVQRKQAEFPAFECAEVVAAVRKGLIARELGYDLDELDWVIDQVRLRLDQ